MCVFAAFEGHAATRRLESDCKIPNGFVAAATAPFDLDWCVLQDRDDVHRLLLDIANRWPGSVYVRAPSATLTLETDTTDWSIDPARPVKNFSFIEDEDTANRLTLRHRSKPSNGYVLWRFVDFKSIRIGGANRALTFQGTHPGLGNGNPETNSGLLDFRLAGGGLPQLLDVRANVRDAQDYGFYIGGGPSAARIGGKLDRVEQLNLAGQFWNAPVFVHAGVQSLWFDPDSLVISDPYNRVMGWDGAVATTVNGRRIGCIDRNRKQSRASGGSFYYVDRASGGLTLEYGTLSFIPRMVGEVGKSEADPFVIRIKDWGASGPQSQTGLTSGVAVKQSVEAIVFKGDSHPDYGRAAPFRFLRFELLESEFGNGVYSPAIASGCAPGNPTSNFFESGYSNLFRLEANRGGQPYRNVNAYWSLELQGDFDGSFIGKGPLLYTSFEPEDTPGPPEPDRSYGHVILLGPGTSIKDSVNLLDHITATGAGTWRDLTVKSVVLASGRVLTPVDNVVRDTNVRGLIDVASGAVGTRVLNVDFRAGPARTIIRAGARSQVDVQDICAPMGSRIEGQGRVLLDGLALALPYTVRASGGCDSGRPPSPITGRKR